MPQVGNLRFPYTPEGKAAARAQAKLKGSIGPILSADPRSALVPPYPPRPNPSMSDALGDRTGQIRDKWGESSDIPAMDALNQVQNPYRAMTQDIQNRPDPRARPVQRRANPPLRPDLPTDAGTVPTDPWESQVRGWYDRIKQMMESMPPADRNDPMKRRALLEAMKIRDLSQRDERPQWTPPPGGPPPFRTGGR